MTPDLHRSCSKPSDVYLCGYAVVRLPDEIVEGKPLPYTSAQAAELVALTRACQLSEGKVVTIYTDSKYAYDVVHDFAKTWKQRHCKTADGKPIAHTSESEVEEDIKYWASKQCKSYSAGIIRDVDEKIACLN
ncbi:RNase H family protein [Cetobacterium sp.]|uniref:RNase H family protein n=1 Tax=Cetobacterium sp. TaxID=2071632 RepID=UPI003EE5EF8B